MKAAILCLAAFALGVGATLLVVSTNSKPAAPPPAQPAAAVPWTKNQENEAATLRSQLAEAQKELAKLKGPEKGLVAKTEGEKSKEEKPGLLTMLGGDNMKTIMEAGANSQRKARVSRLANRLKLSDEQKAALEKHLAEADAQRMKAMQRSFALMGKPPGEWTAEEKAEMEAIGKNQNGSIKDWAVQNLSADQQAELQRYQEERRASQAEMTAQMRLNEMSQVLDLSEDQKDKLFAHFSKQAMSGPMWDDDLGGDNVIMASTAEPPEAGVAEGGAVAVAGTVATDVAAGGLFAPGADDEAFKSILTPDQMAAYQKHQ